MNDRVALAEVRTLLQRRILEAHMLSGVTVIDPATTYVDAGVEIGRDAVLEPMTVLRGATRVGAGSRVGPSTTLIDARLGEGVTILNAHVVDAELHDGVTVGPFAYLRPGTVLRAGSKAGTFVELKNSDIGEGTKVPHLSYLGDADVGPGTNIGAANVTANYDGVRKHRTTIGKGVKTAVDTTFVAPVQVGDNAWTGAGAVVRKDVPDGALAVGVPAQGHRGLRRPQARPGRLLRGLDSPFAMSTTIVPQPHPSTRLEVGYEKNLMLFTGRANPVLAAKIADKLGVDLGPVTLKTFTNGEVYCRYEESIRGADVFIVQPTCGNPVTGVSPNDALMELMFMIEAAVGASAHRVIAVVPWFGYSRQDKKSAPREPISARLVARMLETAGADRVVTMDLHAGQIQGFFHKPVDHMTSLFMLTRYFEDLGLSDLVVVAPDAGRVKLNKKFATKIGAELAILDKERPAQQVAEIGYVIGDVRDKTAVIVDDIIDTAGTLAAAGLAVRDAGARQVYAAATHPVMSGKAFSNLSGAGFEQVVVTDTIPLRPGAPSMIRVLSCAELLTDSIRRIFTDDSVSEVFGGENQLF